MPIQYQVLNWWQHETIEHLQPYYGTNPKNTLLQSVDQQSKISKMLIFFFLNDVFTGLLVIFFLEVKTSLFVNDAFTIEECFEIWKVYFAG